MFFFHVEIFSGMKWRNKKKKSQIVRMKETVQQQHRKDRVQNEQREEKKFIFLNCRCFFSGFYNWKLCVYETK